MRESWKESIIKVVEQCPEVERVRLFDSRAKGTARDGSDIDIAREGAHLDRATVLQIQNHIDELNLPVNVDIVHGTPQTKATLRDHIDRVGIEWLTRC